GDDLFAASAASGADDRFRYLFEEPPATRADFQAWLDKAAAGADPMFWAVVDMASGEARGRQAFMRIEPAHGVIEIGSILWGPGLSRTPGATEALFLFARHAFETLGYRRFEWKCHNDNAPSKRAASRFGFTYEGLFRQHMVAKGRNRDTAWFSIIDGEWPVLKAAYEQWLAPANFDAQGRQRLSLPNAIAAARMAGLAALRRATPADRPVLEALQRDAFARNEPILGVTPLPLCADYGVIMHECEVWLAEDPDGATGAIILKPQADHLELWSIAVASRAQGKGLGKRLLAAAEKRAKDLGYRIIRLMTGEKLVHNVAWYQRSGFSIDRIEQMPDRRAAHMSKWIG
ncbi:MAG: N-acetyltransferase, partial [Rhizobiales bacterium]|nr:N-acetyltransferase [Hyphomicrobiales bacterium]